jgi:hypothetical protein
MSEEKPAETAEAAAKTVGSLSLGTAGILEVGRSGGILGVGLWMLWQAINGDLTALHGQVNGVSAQVTTLTTKVDGLGSDLQTLRNDVTRLQVQADVRERDKRTP